MGVSTSIKYVYGCIRVGWKQCWQWLLIYLLQLLAISGGFCLQGASPEEIDLHEASGPVNVGRNNVMCKNIFPQPYNFKALFTLANKLARQNFIDRHVGSTNWQLFYGPVHGIQQYRLTNLCQADFSFHFVGWHKSIFLCQMCEPACSHLQMYTFVGVSMVIEKDVTVVTDSSARHVGRQNFLLGRFVGRQIGRCEHCILVPVSSTVLYTALLLLAILGRVDLILVQITNDL